MVRPPLWRDGAEVMRWAVDSSIQQLISRHTAEGAEDGGRGDGRQLL